MQSDDPESIPNHNKKSFYAHLGLGGLGEGGVGGFGKGGLGGGGDGVGGEGDGGNGEGGEGDGGRGGEGQAEPRFVPCCGGKPERDPHMAGL